MGVVTTFRVTVSSKISLIAIVGFAARVMGTFGTDTMMRVMMC